MNQRIVFFASGDFVIPIVKKLEKRGLVFVVTTEQKVEDEAVPPLISYLEEKNIAYISSDLKRGSDIEKLRHYAPNIGVLASYGAIIKRVVLDMFIYGIFNIHPSILPMYRGPSPIQAAILSGDTKTGVTIIRLDEEVDHGPILAQREVELEGNENYLDLRNKLFEIGSQMIELLTRELRQNGHLVETAQDETKASFTKKITREDGQIDIENPLSIETINRMIRAYYPWPGVFIKTRLTGSEKIIKLLPGGKIQVEGKNVMTLADFANGYQSEGREILARLSLSY